jgi:hypothetical protein
MMAFWHLSLVADAAMAWNLSVQFSPRLVRTLAAPASLTIEMR